MLRLCIDTTANNVKPSEDQVDDNKIFYAVELSLDNKASFETSQCVADQSRQRVDGNSNESESRY